MEEWATYFETPASKRDKLLNVITLEIGDTPLGELVTRPKLVRDLDWVDLVWPDTDKVIDYPRVQVYCLMGVKCCYTEYSKLTPVSTLILADLQCFTISSAEQKSFTLLNLQTAT